MQKTAKVYQVKKLIVDKFNNLLIYLRIKPFEDSESYWQWRYKLGGSSGAGSYGKLAEFKADILNNFVKSKQIKTVIEYGCGDGNQLKLSDYPSYTGFDVSFEAISQCRKIFDGDETKRFKLVDDYAGEMAQLTLSLDVIYHLVEDENFSVYMERLFDSSTHYIAIYSSNFESSNNAASLTQHVRHRQFTNWVDENRPDWRLIQHIPNKYSYDGNQLRTSFADFYIYEKV